MGHEFTRCVMVTGLELDDQCNRLNNLQLALYDTRSALEALATGHLSQAQTEAIARLLSFAVENHAEGEAEAAVNYADQLKRQITVADQQNEAAAASAAPCNIRACHIIKSHHNLAATKETKP